MGKTAHDALDPFQVDDESPEDRTTRKEVEHLEAKLHEGVETIWSSCSLRRRVYEELAVGEVHAFFHMETSTFDVIQT